MTDNILWVEAYRPQKVADCILPDHLKNPFQSFVEKGNIPNLLLTGGPGVGKTTIAKAMCKEIGSDYLVVNGSQESGIDLLRVKLENYCSNSANPVGHLVLNIFGYNDDLRKTLSDYTCTALQLTNFLQGIQNDYNLGRIYIPNEDMENFNCKEKDILNSNSNPNFIKLIQFQTNRAYDLFKKGEDLFPLITRRFRTDIKLFSIGGTKILDKIKSQGYDIINNPPKLNMKDKLEIIFKSIINK